MNPSSGNRNSMVTFLGPAETTFSHEAYVLLSQMYGVQKVLKSGFNIHAADSNREILDKVCTHGGYGAIAMETFAGGRIIESLESFIDLMEKYPSGDECPIHVIGSIRMKIRFCLMRRKDAWTGITLGILAHAKAIEACSVKIAAEGYDSVAVESNGEAARMVAQQAAYGRHLAIAPKSAALKYELKIMDEDFGNEGSVTAFHLIGPRNSEVKTGKDNRALLVFRIEDTCGALLKVLKVFHAEKFNLIQIHSVYRRKGEYDFVFEVDVPEKKLEAFRLVSDNLQLVAKRHICFGPYEVRDA